MLIENDVMLDDFIFVNVHIKFSLPLDDNTIADSVRSVPRTSSQFLKSWRVNNKPHVSCTVCVKYPDIVKRMTDNKKRAAITLESGTYSRPDIIAAHLKSKYHLECVKIDRMNQLQPSKKSERSVLDSMISKANEKQANVIGKFAYSIYNDAKKLTLAAWNWPSRIVSFELGRLFDFNKTAENSIVADNINKVNLQYVNPKSHAEILECIVNANRGYLTSKIEKCLALSLRADGSIDRTNIDKIYVLAKIVNENGTLETLFLGVGQQSERGAAGLFKTIKETINSHGDNLYSKTLEKMSSVVTDGATDNRYGLWAIMEKEVESTGSTLKILKIWCAAHRSELAWKSVADKVPEVEEIFNKIVAIGTHFHTSAMRQAELKQIADENGLNLKHLPRLFTVRWTEFSHTLLDSYLISWHAIVLYSEKFADNSFMRFLTNYKLLKVIAFLADLLIVYSRFQMKLQSDNLHIVSMHHVLIATTEELRQLKTQNLVGGWESTLDASVIVENNDDDDDDADEVKLKGIELDLQELERRGAHNKKRDFNKIRSELIDNLLKFMNDRFECDKELIETVSPFVNLNKANTNVEKVHELIAPDLDVTALHLQFGELCGVEGLNKMNLHEMVFHLKSSEHASMYSEALTVLARILAATPHSADCERVISANNLLKTASRNSLNIETENRYLHVHFNMPPLFEWEPRKTVMNWMMKKERRQHDLIIESDEHKAKEQPHFLGVFCQAEESRKRKGNEDENEDNVSTSSKHKFKRRCF